MGSGHWGEVGGGLRVEVVAVADERTRLMVTTYQPFEEGAEIMGNERMTGALLDRLTHKVHIIEANGESYRLKQAKRGTAASSNKPGSKT